MNLFFSPWDSLCKFPFGGVKTGEIISLTVFVPPESGILSVDLILRSDDDHRCRRLKGKQKALLNCNSYYHNPFCWQFSVEEAGIYFYRFEGITAEGTLFFGKGEDESALCGEFLPEWQLTIYKSSFSVPEKRKEGLIYQIFPDRFFKGEGVPLPEMPHKRLLHQSWGELPLSDRDTSPYEANDFFGGNLRGITEKLSYLKSLGVTCIYLNPVFEAASNHRYNTGDYKKIDPWLGSIADFTELIGKAKEQGIDILLDGVFSHTGSDSVYFNKDGHYPLPGAYSKESSPYDSWYRICDDGSYDCWWGFSTLPNVIETDPSFLEFICGEEGILAFWQQKGIAGWRLDVADELPDEFLSALRNQVKALDPKGFILGEVWEDASNKESYGKRRQYLLGQQLDSVMNYPFRTAVLEFIKNGNGELFFRRIMTIADHYPPPALHSAMNPISTHDTVRALTFLEEGDPLNEKRRLQLATLLQYTLPGVPSIYYGDEAGLSGERDPFNRRCYPWGEEDKMLQTFFMSLGALRQSFPQDLKEDIHFLTAKNDLVCYKRGQLLVAVNRGEKSIDLPISGELLLAVGDIAVSKKKITTAALSGAVVLL